MDKFLSVLDKDKLQQSTSRHVKMKLLKQETKYVNPKIATGENGSKFLDKVLSDDSIRAIIFSQLEFTDLKSCRLVNNKWSEFSKEQLAKSSICNINNAKKEGEMEKFYNCFSEDPHWNFKQFQLEGIFKIFQLTDFFSQWRNVEQLTLKNFRIADFEGRLKNDYNMRFMPPMNLTSLRVLSTENVTDLAIPLSVVRKTKTLILDGKVTIQLSERKIAPTILEIGKEVKFYREGQYCEEELLINDFVDVTHLKELKVERELADLKLEVTKCLQLENLDLFNVKVDGWNSGLKIKTLRFWTEIDDVTLDVALLPQSVDALDVKRVTLDSGTAAGRMAVSIEMILEKVISHLAVNELKTCRLVCRTWNKKSAVRFKKLSYCNIRDTSGVTSFDSCFPNPSQWRFDKFCLSGTCSQRVLSQFFSKWKNVKYMKLDDFRVNDSKKSYCDISWWIKQLNLTTLAVTRSTQPIVVQMGHLKNVQKLHLYNESSILLNGRIAPVDLAFGSSVQFIDNKTDLHISAANTATVPVAQFLDCEHVKELRLFRSMIFCRLNVAPFLNLRTLSVFNVLTHGWHNAMSIRRLRISYGNGGNNDTPPPAFDISLLPRHMVMLELHAPNGGTVAHSAPFTSFPVVQTVEYYGPTNLYSLCPSMSTLTTGRSRIEVKLLPKTIKNVILREECEILGQRKNGILNALVLQSGHAQTVLQAIDALPTATIVIDYFNEHHDARIPNRTFDIVLKVIMLKIAEGVDVVIDNSCPVSRVANTCTYGSKIFERCPFLKNVVNKKGHHYYRRNGEWRVMNGENFKRLMKL